VIAFSLLWLWKVWFGRKSEKGKNEFIAPKSLANYLFTENQMEAYIRQQ
jgi:hypothetical protein